ncbi:Protein of unknown function [Prevotella sp. kh1p2]|nr:Protein of unknown function [Prevotella sp. kh1p2]SNU10836.1 Protein of unknown function [Prevotellaceae bacterium KH2P17]
MCDKCRKFVEHSFDTFEGGVKAPERQGVVLRKYGGSFLCALKAFLYLCTHNLQLRMSKMNLHILQVGNVLVSPDIFTEKFCCDLDICKGACCVEGDAGAPVSLDEIGQIEASLDTVWPDLSASAQAVIDKQGVAYTDAEGELVTSIVNGKDCVFTCYDKGTCLCALEKACRAGRSRFMKPISCALYPVREKRFDGDLVGINYHRWAICSCAVRKGEQLDLPLYRFLEGPLVRRFGREWYNELCAVAEELKKGGFIE